MTDQERTDLRELIISVRDDLKEDIEEVKTLARTTNGRVTKLEAGEIAAKAAAQARFELTSERESVARRWRDRFVTALASLAVGSLLALLGAYLASHPV